MNILPDTVKRKTSSQNLIQTTLMKSKRKSTLYLSEKSNQNEVIQPTSSQEIPKQSEVTNNTSIETSNKSSIDDIPKRKGRPRKYPHVIAQRLKKGKMIRGRINGIEGDLKLPRRLVKTVNLKSGKRSSLSISDKLEILDKIEKTNIHVISNATGFHVNTLKYWVNRKEEFKKALNEKKQLTNDKNNNKTSSPMNVDKTNDEKAVVNNKEAVENKVPFKNIPESVKLSHLPNTPNKSPATSQKKQNYNIVKSEEVTANLKQKIKEEIKTIIGMYDSSSRSISPLVQYFAKSDPQVHVNIKNLYSLLSMLVKQQLSNKTLTQKQTIEVAIVKLYEYYIGEYELLKKISQEFESIANKDKNSTNDADSLKSYFTFSINRFKELQNMLG